MGFFHFQNNNNNSNIINNNNNTFSPFLHNPTIVVINSNLVQSSNIF